MDYLFLFIGIALLLQIVLFFVIRRRNKKLKEENVLFKYNINTSGDAFSLLNNPDIPDIDKKEIEKFYKERNK